MFSEVDSATGEGLVRVFSEAAPGGYFRETVFSEVVAGARVVALSAPFDPALIGKLAGCSNGGALRTKAR